MVGNMLGHLPSAPNLTKTPLKDFQERGQLFEKYEALRAAPVHKLKTNLNNMLEKMKEVERFERKVFVEYLWTMLKVDSIQAFINEEKRLERSKKAIKLELDVADKRVAINRIDRDMQPEDRLKNAHRDRKYADASMGTSAASTEGEGHMPPLLGGADPLHNPMLSCGAVHARQVTISQVSSRRLLFPSSSDTPDVAFECVNTFDELPAPGVADSASQGYQEVLEARLRRIADELLSVPNRKLVQRVEKDDRRCFADWINQNAHLNHKEKVIGYCHEFEKDRQEIAKQLTSRWILLSQAARQEDKGSAAALEDWRGETVLHPGPSTQS
ncbi:hypothetical protein JCM11641_005656 [Rhodosporidiobolus odoratus]